MHAFNFAPYDNIEIKVGTNTLISDQRSFSRIQSGSFVQVRKKDIVKQELLVSGFSAKHQPFRTKHGAKVLQPGSPQSRVTTERDYQAMSATNEAALALAALSSDSDPQKFWAHSEQSASGIM